MADDKERAETLRAMTRAELVALANSQGLNIPDDTSKNDALAALGVTPPKK